MLVMNSGATIYLACILWKSLLAQMEREDTENTILFSKHPLILQFDKISFERVLL